MRNAGHDCCEPDNEDIGDLGVTLIELLVVLGLMALIGVFMTNGLKSVKAVLPMTQRIEAAETLTLVRDHLRRTLSEAIGRSVLSEDLHFSGDASLIRFVAPSDTVFETGGLDRITLRAVPSQGTGGLALIEERRLERPEWNAKPQTTTLLDGIASFSILYRRGAETPAAITSKDSPPNLVVIDVRFPVGDGRTWVPLAVNLAAVPP